jgi:hypothetical protein
MYGRLKTATLGALVASAALVPLFGDPRQTPVTHAVWGRMLLRALDMKDAVSTSTQASQVFATLAWRDSLTLTAEQFSKSDGLRMVEEAGTRRMVAGPSPGEAVYTLAVLQGGDYRFRARLRSEDARAASAEIAPLGGRPFKTLTLAADGDWALGGAAHLDPGAYTASVLLPAGAGLERLEIAPPCIASCEPVGGWHATAVTTAGDLAVTSVRALDLEDELPPADTPLTIEASAFEVDERLASPEADDSLDAGALRAGSGGLRALVTLDLPEPGLYTVSAFGSAGAGQRWLADGCRKAVICPAPSAGWRVVMSQPMRAGRHTLSVTLGEGGVVERVRVERKKDGVSDYLATLRRLGFDPGPEGPVTRERALAAMEFVRSRHRERAARLCGDPSLPEWEPPPGAQVAATQPAGRPISPNPPPPPDVFGPTLLPPQEPASPVSPQAAVPSSAR